MNKGAGRQRLCSLYKDASVILKNTIEDRQTSLRTAVFSSQTHNKKLLYKLCCQTLHMVKLESDIILKSPLLEEMHEIASKEHELWLLRVLLYEFLFGTIPKPIPNFPSKWRKKFTQLKGEKSGIKEKLATQVKRGDFPIKPDSYFCYDVMKRRVLKRLLLYVINQGLICCNGELSTDDVKLPRYCRVNTLKTSVGEVVDELEVQGWTQLDIAKDKKSWKTQVQNLESNEFVLDITFPAELVIFSGGTDLHDNALVLSGKLILQDKASILPVQCLNIPASSCVVDTCAAPGIKSIHLACITGQNGKVLSFDKDGSRICTMKHMLTKYEANYIVDVKLQDFLKVDVVNDQRFNQVEYALVDPPCSGSGIASRPGIEKHDIDERRLNSLGNIQAMLCKHALKLPNLKRLVYSTCSVHERENEMVISEILDCVGDNFELVEAMPEWKHRGRKGYDFSRLCLRSSIKKDLTNGFFVAVFEKRNCLNGS